MTADPPRTTRRGLLALAGATTVAGCGGFPFGSSPPTLDAVRLTEITAGEVPAIPRTVPVAIVDDHVAGHADRVRDLLGRAPLPFAPDEIPNGAMREELNGVATAARTAVDDARDAPSPLEAIATLREARAKARTVATAWAYADAGLRRPAVEEDAATLDDAVEAFRDRRAYVGDDPVRALLVHEAIESLVRDAETAAADGSEEHVTRVPDNLVTISERAGEIERGRAALADAAHLRDRFRADLSTARDLAGAFEAALADLRERLRAGTAALDRNDPVSTYVTADVAGSSVGHALRSLHGHLASADSNVSRRLDRVGVATALRAVHRDLAQLRAFQRLRERVEGGESFAVESATDVAALRDDAVTAIGSALRESDHPHLSRTVLHDATRFVEHTDGEVGGYEDREEVPVEFVRRDLGDYVYVAAVARATPGASDAVAAALGN